MMPPKIFLSRYTQTQQLFVESRCEQVRSALTSLAIGLDIIYCLFETQTTLFGFFASRFPLRFGYVPRMRICVVSPRGEGDDRGRIFQLICVKDARSI